MQISDIHDNIEVLWRAGRLVEYHGDVARYGEVAHHYEGGACWQTGWQRGRLSVRLREKDLPNARRRHTRFWQEGSICHIAIFAPDGQPIPGAAPEFSPDDLSQALNAENNPTGAIQAMVENYVWEFRLPNDTVLPTPADSTFPPPNRPSP